MNESNENDAKARTPGVTSGGTMARIAKDPFGYIKPTETSVKHIEDVRTACRDLAKLIEFAIPFSREKSLALTKLEEVSMWANKAIVFNQKEE